MSSPYHVVMLRFYSGVGCHDRLSRHCLLHSHCMHVGSLLVYLKPSSFPPLGLLMWNDIFCKRKERVNISCKKCFCFTGLNSSLVNTLSQWSYLHVRFNVNADDLFSRNIWGKNKQKYSCIIMIFSISLFFCRCHLLVFFIRHHFGFILL